VAIQPGTERATRYGEIQDYWTGRKETAPTLWFSPGETVTRTLHSSDGEFDNQTMRLFEVPNEPGQFQLLYTYHYRTVPAKFRVLPAVLLTPVFVPLQATGQYQSDTTNRIITYQKHVALLVVQALGKYYIVASQRSIGKRYMERDPTGHFMEDLRVFAPIIRVFESDQPIVSVSGIELSPGNAAAAGGSPLPPESMRVNWTTADRNQSTVILGPDRKPVL
jgi:hypothetical protein